MPEDRPSAAGDERAHGHRHARQTATDGPLVAHAPVGAAQTARGPVVDYRKQITPRVAFAVPSGGAPP
jgi:hypothetical protein